jgi:hypothetical protein
VIGRQAPCPVRTPGALKTPAALAACRAPASYGAAIRARTRTWHRAVGRRCGRRGAVRAARRRWPMDGAACVAAQAPGRGRWRASPSFASPVRSTGFTALIIKRRGGMRPPYRRCSRRAGAAPRWRSSGGCDRAAPVAGGGRGAPSPGEGGWGEDPMQREEGGAMSRGWRIPVRALAGLATKSGPRPAHGRLILGSRCAAPRVRGASLHHPCRRRSTTLTLIAARRDLSREERAR